MKNVLIFLAGAGIGSVITWKLIEKKYKDLADEEIESVKEVFKKRLDELQNKEQLEVETLKSEETKTSKNKSSKSKSKKEIAKEIIVEEEYDNSVITIIKEEDYGQLDDYEMCTGLYYKDGKLTLDNVEEEPVSDPIFYVGHALDIFEENKYVENVFVRNDDTKCDYEILRSEKNYSDLI